MRSLFTSGVLDVLLENKIEFPYVIGVSAGALTGVNYISKDIGRTARINIGFADDSRYLGVGNLLRKKSLFDFDFLFGRTDKIVPMDYDTFYNSKQRFVAVATDCATGRPVYFEKGKTEDIMKAVRASSSMPLLAPVVHLDGMDCLDGGVSDPIPFRHAMQEGYDRVVLVLTRDASFRAADTTSVRAYAILKTFRGQPNFASQLATMSMRYNKTLDELRALEAAGKLFVIRPDRPVTVGRAERNPDKLEALYNEGRAVMSRELKSLRKYVGFGLRDYLPF